MIFTQLNTKAYSNIFQSILERCRAMKILSIFCLALACLGCQPTKPQASTDKKSSHIEQAPYPSATMPTKTSAHLARATQAHHSPALVSAARAQIGVTTSYDPTYRQLAFPMGDVDKHTGVCTDVVIRAYRAGGKDLQQLVNQDMKQAWQAYPKTWGLTHPDPNIDHRRVPNLAVFFSRHGKTLSTTDKTSFRAGDIVTWQLIQGNKRLPHIGIVSDKQTTDGTPFIIHNIGRGTEESNMLYQFPITGHYRY